MTYLWPMLVLFARSLLSFVSCSSTRETLPVTDTHLQLWSRNPIAKRTKSIYALDYLTLNERKHSIEFSQYLKPLAWPSINRKDV